MEDDIDFDVDQDADNVDIDDLEEAVDEELAESTDRRNGKNHQ